MTLELWGWLAGLFGSAFVSATILPGNSEAALVALLHFQPQLVLAAVLVATLGNVLGGLTTVWLGRRLPALPAGRVADWARRVGPISLLMSWFPVLGDALCGVAGWLRWPWWPVALWITLGKAVRYGVVAYLTLAVLQG